MCLFSFCTLSFSFDDCVERIKEWLEQMDLSLKSESVLEAASQKGCSDPSEELQKMENLNKELIARRFEYMGA